MKKTLNKKLLISSIILIILALGLTLISRQSLAFSLFYGKNVTPVFVNTLGRIFSPLPFSVFEILVYASIVFIPYGLFKARFRIKTLFLASILLLLFTLTAGINYSSPYLFEGFDLDSQKYSEEDLIGLYQILLDDVSGLSAQVQRDSQGLLSIENIDLKSASIDAMGNLQERFPKLAGYYPRPKPVFSSKAMSYLGITGIFSPFSLEANYNKDIASYLIPFTMCHEFAHLKGFMREEEANFIAYLACKDSSLAELKYSGALNALSYTLNALSKTVEKDLYEDLFLGIPEVVRLEMAHNRAYWKAHTVKITGASTKINDTYLKANAQSAGVKSYGLVVQLLLEEYYNFFIK